MGKLLDAAIEGWDDDVERGADYCLRGMNFCLTAIFRRRNAPLNPPAASRYGDRDR